MLDKKQQRLFTIISVVIIIALSIGLIKFNLKLQKENIAEAEKIEDESADIEDEKEINIPPIKVPKKEDTQSDKTDIDKEDNDEDIEIPEYKEEIKEIDGNKVLVKPTPPPKKENTPEAMEKPKKQPKPKEPPKLEEKADKTNPDKPPAYEKEEESYMVEKDGKWYVKGVNGDLFPIEGDPYGEPDIIDSSELGRPGDPEMGEGDKF